MCIFSDTMMKFACFETIVEMLYKYAIPIPKDKCSKKMQLGVSFVGGYVAGVLCAVVSHPADNLVSFLNNSQGATIGCVSRSCPFYLHISKLKFHIEHVKKNDFYRAVLTLSNISDAYTSFDVLAEIYI